MADEIELEVPDHLDGERVDKTIATLLELSRARASHVVDDGVMVDGIEAGPSDRVRAGSVITCSRPAEVVTLEPEPLELDVLYEDDDLIVVNKPAGVVVHPGSGRRTGTLAAGLLHRYPELRGVGAEDRWGLVHRLDRDTSGAILVARRQDIFDKLKAQMERREISRSYTALVEGRMAAPTGTIEAPIGRDPSHPTRRAVSHTGKAARTHFEVERYFERSDCSLLLVRLETGRTHQIRVHMAAIDHPVVGDIAYGATRKDLSTPRTFLHASRLVLAHPRTGRRLSVIAPLPEDLTGVLERVQM